MNKASHPAHLDQIPAGPQRVGSFDVHSVCPLLQMEMPIISGVCANMGEGMGASAMRQPSKLTEAQCLQPSYRQEWPPPPALEAPNNQCPSPNIPKNKGFGELTSNSAEKGLSDLVPLKLSTSS